MVKMSSTANIDANSIKFDSITSNKLSASRLSRHNIFENAGWSISLMRYHIPFDFKLISITELRVRHSTFKIKQMKKKQKFILNYYESENVFEKEVKTSLNSPSNDS